MAIYDVNGNVISANGEITDEQVRDAFLEAIADGTINPGVTIGATLSHTMDSTWQTKAVQAYNLMLARYKIDTNNSVPFFISTDQHGAGLQQHRWANNQDVDGVGYMSINLGDTVQDVYGQGTVNGFYDVTKQVKNYIGVVGNHEEKYYQDPILKLTLSKSFGTTNLLRYNSESILDCYVIVDGFHKVKYMILEDYYNNADNTGYTHGFDGKTVDWMIDWLSRNDGLDTIILMHWPCFRKFAKRGMEQEVDDGDSSLGYINRWDAGAYLLWDFFVARKLKQSGSYTDKDGVSHAYDFSNCETDLLCTLHGHTHAEWYTTSYGLTGYACNRFDATNERCVFGLVDRMNQKLRIWEFGKDTILDELVLDI